MRRLYACFFPLAGQRKYIRMARVLEYTARKHCPGWDVRVEQIAPVESVGERVKIRHLTGKLGSRHGLRTNTDKRGDGVRFGEGCQDGDEIMLVDADTMVMRPLDPVWDLEFDVAYTVKELCPRLPINGGVVPLRVNERSRAFMRQWLAVNDRLYVNPVEHKRWRDSYGGMNQAALGYMLETGDMPACQLLELQAAEWNSCHERTWRHAHDARIVHVKSALRRSVFARPSPDPAVRALSEEWKRLEVEAQRQNPAAAEAV